MEAAAGEIRAGGWLVCRTGNVLLGLPLCQIGEVMRPLPVEPVVDMPPSVRGLCIVRGSPVPVIDAGRLINGIAARIGRLVTVLIGGRVVALAVDEVIGVQSIEAEVLCSLPPLLRSAAAEAVDALRALDGELLLLLDAARLIPSELAELGEGIAAS